MSKQKTLFVCQNCGSRTPRWAGQCADCHEWNTLVEEVVIETKSNKSGLNSRRSNFRAELINLSEVQQKPLARVQTGISEFDRVLGGGFVPGQVVLISGEPGIGKSTLLTQISKRIGGAKVIYVCGEESPQQISLRAQRMGYKADNLLMLTETDVDVVIDTIEAYLSTENVSLIIVDSIQTITSGDFMGFSGSIGQVRGSTQKLTELAKRTHIPTILVGHVNKMGNIAGPKVLEHIIDTVLSLEGDEQNMFRILKTTKNRFGPVSEVGLFEMVENGLAEVLNPSEVFLSGNADASGTCTTVVMEGQRPLLFEIQALATKSYFGFPKRTASGLGVTRIQLLIAILEKRCGLRLSEQDVYLNVAGGFKIEEYAGDLAICLAIASSLKDKPLGKSTIAIGECGLNGEIRRVSNLDRRVKEAKKLGYTNIITPDSHKNLSGLLKDLF